MARVWIPMPLRDLTRGQEMVDVPARNVRQVVDELETLFPGVKARLCQGAGLRPGLAVAVDGQLANLGLLHPVGPDSEVHFYPAIGGGEPP